MQSSVALVSRVAKAVAIVLIFVTTITWAVTDRCIAIEPVAQPEEHPVIEVTSEGYPIRLLHEGIETHIEAPTQNEVPADADLAVAYVKTIAGPMALVMDDGLEGFCTIAWIPRVEEHNPCFRDVEFVGTELRVVGYRWEAPRWCERSTVRSYRLEHGRLRATPSTSLAPKVTTAFGPILAHDISSHGPPLVNPE